MTPSVPKVSVCLLSYNHEHVVEAAIDSVLAQDFSDFELILSDDRSTDRTWDRVRAYEARDARVRAVQPPRNLGMAGNSNFAFGLARSPYVALLHHDDLCSPNLLRRWVEVLDRYPSVGFVSNAYVNEDGSDTVQDLPECSPGRIILEGFLLAQWGCIFRGTAMVRRTALDAVGPMRERFGMLADVDLWMRLAREFDVGYAHDAHIRTRVERPAYYPKEYWQWSWTRLKLLYEIHGTNTREHYGEHGLRARAQWLRFRARVNGDTLYWLTYAVLKRRWGMLASANQVANEFEWPAERVLREFLQRAGARLENYLAAPTG